MNGNTKKGCLWALNPGKIEKMTEEIAKHRKKDLAAIKSSMSMPGKEAIIYKTTKAKVLPAPKFSKLCFNVFHFRYIEFEF